VNEEASAISCTLNLSIGTLKSSYSNGCTISSQVTVKIGVAVARRRQTNGEENRQLSKGIETENAVVHDHLMKPLAITVVIGNVNVIAVREEVIANDVTNVTVEVKRRLTVIVTENVGAVRKEVIANDAKIAIAAVTTTRKEDVVIEAATSDHQAGGTGAARETTAPVGQAQVEFLILECE